jgi:hypothetical protein
MNPTTTGRFRVFPGPDEDRWLFVSLEPPSDEDGPDEAYAPTYVPVTGHGDLDETVAGLRPGHVIEATMLWEDDRPRITDLAVERRSLFEFADGATGLFEAAQNTWAEAVAAGEPMNSRVTYDTDGEPNGVLYVFAQQSGAQDLFEEFRSGVRPLEPLVERIDEAEPDDGGADSGVGHRDERPDDASLESGERPADEPSTADGERSPGQVSLGPGGNVVVGDEDDDAGDPAREVFVMRPADDPYVVVYIVLQKGSLLANTMRDTYHCPRPDEPIG